MTGCIRQLGAPAAEFALSERYTTKTTRSMGRVALMATRASELALVDAGLAGDPLVKSGHLGIAYGSSAGTPKAICDFGMMISEKSTKGINATTYIKMMGHTAPVNLGVFLGVTGRIITTSSACTSGSQGIGYGYETIRAGQQRAMIAGGAEELCVTEVAVFDTLFATSVRNDDAETTPRPFDIDRDGLVLGEGAGTLILEEYRTCASARRAHLCRDRRFRHQQRRLSRHSAQRQNHASGDGAGAGRRSFAALSDRLHQCPWHRHPAWRCRRIASDAITCFGNHVPVSSLKSYMGHTLGACGALEAWMTIEMMRSGWFAPTINLANVDPACAELDYIVNQGRVLECEYVMSNNFAFGGINTSLIFRRMA